MLPRENSKWVHTESGGVYEVIGLAVVKSRAKSIDGRYTVVYKDSSGQMYTRSLPNWSARMVPLDSPTGAAAVATAKRVG